MTLLYQMIVCVLVTSTLCCDHTGEFTFKTKCFKGMYGDCMSIPFNYIAPRWNGSLPYNKVWIRKNNGIKEYLTLNQNPYILELPQLPPGEHRIGLMVEWGDLKNTSETVQVSVSALTKKPDVTIDNLIEGHLASVQCMAPVLCTMERPKIIWKGINVATVVPVSGRMRYSRIGEIIYITPKAEDHNTNITCQLRYRHTMIEKTVTLKVQYPAKILNFSKCILRDSKMLCQCVSQGNPQPTINWIIPCGSYQTIYASNDSETQEESVYVLGSYNYISTIQCVSSNYLGISKINLKPQNLTSLTNLSEELQNTAKEDQKLTLFVPWIIIGVSLSLNLVMIIIVIYQYKKAHKKICNEEVNMYASLRKTSTEHEYSVIPAHRINLI